MDSSVLGGLALALVAVLGADLIDGGKLAALINPAAALLVIGGTLGATILSCRLEDILAIPAALRSLLRPERFDLPSLVEHLVALALKARRSGLLSLEEDIGTAADPFLARGLQMLVDGADADTLRGVLQVDMALASRNAAHRAGVFETAGGFAPTMGIIGTVLGLVHVLGNLSDASALGPAIATAFLATYSGISTANLFWLPVANKLHANARLQQLAHEVAMEGILSIQAGDNPSAVRDKLAVFLRHATAPQGKGRTAAPAAEASGGAPTHGGAATPGARGSSSARESSPVA